jgi:integrase
MFSILTGVRRGEISALTWDNVDLSDNCISIVKNIERITITNELNLRHRRTERSAIPLRYIPM